MDFLKDFGSIAVDVALICACITFIVSLVIQVVRNLKNKKNQSNDSHDVTNSFGDSENK